MSFANWMRLILLSVLWGGSFFCVEVALADLPALTIVWCRVGLAALVLAIVLRVSGQKLPSGPDIWPALALMGLLNNVIPFSLFVLAQGQITGSLAAIVNATTPLWTILLAHVATRDERLTTPRVIGVALGFAGVVVLMAGTQARADIWAIAACGVAAMSYACAGVWGRRFARMGVPPLATAFGQVAASTMMLLPVWVWVDRPWTLPMPGVSAIGAICGIALLSTALAYVIYFRLLASAGATNLLLVTFLIPVSATLLGVVVLGDPVRLGQLAGFGLIVCGLVAIDGRLGRRLRWWRRAAGQP